MRVFCPGMDEEGEAEEGRDRAQEEGRGRERRKQGTRTAGPRGSWLANRERCGHYSTSPSNFMPTFSYVIIVGM